MILNTLEGMTLLVEAVDGGSFSEAARRLGMAPSSVARGIGALEDDLGVRLFNRTTRSLSLTCVSCDQIVCFIAFHLDAGHIESTGRIAHQRELRHKIFRRRRAVPTAAGPAPLSAEERSRLDRLLDDRSSAGP